MMFDAVFVEIDGAGRHIIFIDRDFTHATACLQLDTQALVQRPISNFDAALGTFCTSRVARPQVRALLPTFIVLRNDRRICRPPVPAQLVETTAHRIAHIANRNVMQRHVVVRNHRISGQTGYTHILVVLREVRIEILVGEWPVIRHTIQRFHTEVRGFETWEMCRIEDRPAANTVEVRHRDRRLILVDRVVRITLAYVWTLVVSNLPPHLPVFARARIIGRIHPVTLLQAQNTHPRIRHAPGEGSC